MLILLLSLACTTATTSSVIDCSVELARAEPAEAPAGALVRLYADPLTDSWDTAVTFGATRATVRELDRSSCEDCEACKDSAGCDVCEDCDVCDLSCDASCIPWLDVEVPALPPGKVSIVVRNSRGTSAPLQFVVTAGDSGSADSAP